MVALMIALAIAPWSKPLAFAPTHGWNTGASGDTRSMYVGPHTWVTEPVESAAWTARGVRYVDRATADSPNETLARLPKGAVIVWAVVFSPLGQNEGPIQLSLARAKRYACCEAARIPAEYELTGAGPHGADSVIVRIYFGSEPNPRLQAQAQLALRRLELPAPR